MALNKTEFCFKCSLKLSKSSEHFQCHGCNSNYHLLCRSPQNAQPQVSPNFYLKTDCICIVPNQSSLSIH